MEKYSTLTVHDARSVALVPASPDDSDLETGSDEGESTNFARVLSPKLFFFMVLTVATAAGACACLFHATRLLQHFNVSSASNFGALLNNSSPVVGLEVGSCANYGCHTNYHPEQSCQCNVKCHDFGNCCQDNDEMCLNLGAKAASCSRYGCHTGYRPAQHCQCSGKCHAFGNCCPDYDVHCAGSCQEFGCGGEYDGSKSCQCSPSCQQYQNCCGDYERICNAPPVPPAPVVGPSTSTEAPLPITRTEAPFPIVSTQEPKSTTEENWQPILPEGERSAEEQAELDEANLQLAVIGTGMLAFFLCSGMCCAIGGMLQEIKTANRDSDFYCRTVQDKDKTKSHMYRPEVVADSQI